jgi:Putative peptidoglycan binding domain
MKKFTSLLIGCSLALAGAAMAQQPEEQSTPKPHQAAEKGKGHPAEATPVGKKEMKPAGTAAKPAGTPMGQQHGGKNGPGGIKTDKAEATPKPAASAGTETKVPAKSATSAVPGARQHHEGMKAPAANAKAAAIATPAAAAAATAAPAVSPAIQPKAAQANTAAAAKKPDPQQVQQIKAQHANFHAQPMPEKVPPVTFTENRRIEGSDRWQGQQYEAYRSYHAERHDQGWYHSHYNRVELIGGGYYYWNNNYWYPAWGYNDSHQYYAYDGPIYVGHRAEPLDRVIADVQGVLQEMGYYKGEVDGLLGPMTREALTAYQADQGLTATAVIDEPTLDSLGMG